MEGQEMMFKKFAKECDGAVTVEWVVVTALAVTLCLTVIGIVGGGLGDLSSNLKTELVSIDSSTAVGNTSSQTGDGDGGDGHEDDDEKDHGGKSGGKHGGKDGEDDFG